MTSTNGKTDIGVKTGPAGSPHPVMGKKWGNGGKRQNKGQEKEQAPFRGLVLGSTFRQGDQVATGPCSTPQIGAG